MGRFYAKFDSGSGGWNAALENTFYIPGFADASYYDRRFVANGSASAAPLRDGLITSRSILSADVYAELDIVNQNATQGTYFPPDTFNTTNNILFFTASAYTSSVQGIIIPPRSSGSEGYYLRPTASIQSNQTALVTATVPLDSASFSAASYLSASRAVQAVLNVISGSIVGGPYARLGNNPNRTLHSIWHNWTLDYFAWDDFTPGAPVLGENFYVPITETCGGDQGGGLFSHYQTSYAFVYGKTFENDFNGGGKMRFVTTWSYSNHEVSTTADTGIISVTGSGTSGALFVYTASLLTLIPIDSNAVNLIAKSTASFYDALIPSSRGTLSYNTYNILFSCPPFGP